MCPCPPSEPAASRRSQEPIPSSNPPAARAPTHTHSRSDSGPPRWNCSRRPHTACRTQRQMGLLVTLIYIYRKRLSSVIISPARPGFGRIQPSSKDRFSTQRVNSDQGEQSSLPPLFFLLLLQKHWIFCFGLFVFFLQGAEKLMLQQN